LGAGDAGALDEDVDIAEGGLHEMAERLERFGAGDIGGVPHAAPRRSVELLGSLAQRLLLQIGEHDPGALAEQLLGGMPSDPRISSGDQCRSSRNAEVHDPLPLNSFRRSSETRLTRSPARSSQPS
jgi:hypothetical protein